MIPKLLLLRMLVFLMPAVLSGQTFIDVEGGGMTYTIVSDGEEIVHDIWVEEFSLAATEVTVSQWRKFTSDTNLDFPWEGHYCGDIAELSPEDNCPIQLIRIEEAAFYCNWLSLKEGLEAVYVLRSNRIERNPYANGYRLPTTEEWDFAARGGRYSLGFIYSGSNNPEEVGWIGQSFENGTMPVGSLSPNEIGLYDMTGNIREWTWPVNGVPYPTTGSEEVLHLRGGNWTSSPEKSRLDYDRIAWVYQWASNGFRLARNAD